MKRMFVLAASALSLGVVACNEGPAERSGQSLDKAGQSVRDAVDPPSGPGERVGRSIDRTVNPGPGERAGRSVDGR